MHDVQIFISAHDDDVQIFIHSQSADFLWILILAWCVDFHLHK